MKKIYITLLLSIPFILSAQTITQADLPHAGSAFTMGNDTSYNAAVPAGGMGQTWDFSALVNHNTDTTGFINAAGTPYASLFPGSNLAMFDPTDGSYSYYTSSASGLFVDGFGGPGSNIAYDLPQLYIPVPFSFGSTTDNTGLLQIDTTVTDTNGTFNYRFIHRIDSHFNGDGTGTLTTPTSTYSNVLRIKVTEITYDSLYIDPLGLGVYVPISGTSKQITNYNYVTSGLPANYILGVEADSAGTTSANAQYLIDATLTVPTVSENKKVVLYPNPVMNNMNFKYLNENSSIVIYDSNGKEAYRSEEILGKNINVETLPNGVYHYEINQKDKSQKGSFVIQH